MRILITGAGGQLGRELQAALAASDLVALRHVDLDVTSTDAVTAQIEGARPQVVIHAAALTDTTRCEREPDMAMNVNALGSENLARACAAVGASMVYVSTNEVFDGSKRSPYLETDQTNPVNEYGRSKLEGEHRVLAILPQHYIVRTSWLYGFGADNFVRKVLGWANGGGMTCVTDEVSTPTWTRDLATAIAQVVRSQTFGVYHFANAGEASRYDLAREVLRLTDHADVEVRPITTRQFRSSLPPDSPAPQKPPYSVLANKCGADLGILLRPWQDALSEYLSGQP